MTIYILFLTTKEIGNLCRTNQKAIYNTDNKSGVLTIMKFPTGMDNISKKIRTPINDLSNLGYAPFSNAPITFPATKINTIKNIQPKPSIKAK